MAWLPFEVWLDIFEQHHFSAGAIPDYLTLRSLSLCCRALEYPAQKELFRHVVLTKQKQALAFAHATDPQTERGKTLGAVVQYLTVKVGESYYGEDIRRPDFVVVFLRCSNLLELTLRSFNLSSDNLSYQDWNSIRNRGPRTLRCIRSQDSGLGFLIARLCPWVTGLSLGGSSLGVTPSGRSIESKGMMELQWYGGMAELVAALNIQTADSDGEYLEPSLEILGLRGVEINVNSSGTGIGKVLTALSRSLRSLHLAQIDESLVDHIRNDLRNLEEFILDNLPSEELLDALPPTIQHLQVRTPDLSACANDVHSELLQQWVATAPSLNILTWMVGPCNGHGTYQELEDSCKDVGATLHLYITYFGTYLGEQDSLAREPVKCFPRPMAAMNGGYMSYSVEEFLFRVKGEPPCPIREQVAQPEPEPTPTVTKKQKQLPRNSRHKKAIPRVPFTVPRLEATSGSSGSTFVPETASGGFTFKFGSS